MNDIKTVKIGGNEYPVRVLYKDVFGFLKAFNRQYIKAKKEAEKTGSEIIIPSEFFFDVLWECLEKRGFWFWRKPFRSKRKMVNSIRYEELSDIILLVSRHVLHMEGGSNEEPGKKKI